MRPICFSIFWALDPAPTLEVICDRPRRKELCHVQIKVFWSMTRSPGVSGPWSFEGRYIGLRKFGNISPNTEVLHPTNHESSQSPVGCWACWKLLNVMCCSVPRGQQFPLYLYWRLCHICKFWSKHRLEKILLMSVLQQIISGRKCIWTKGLVEQGISGTLGHCLRVYPLHPK